MGSERVLLAVCGWHWDTHSWWDITLTSQHSSTHYLNMSWQSYVDDQLISTNMIKNAVIAGHDGNIWASSTGFNVTAAELKVILDRYTNTDLMAMNGLMVGGTKYMFLSANDRVIRGKKGQAGGHCIKKVQALIVCVRGARGPRAGGHSDGETRGVSHLGGILTLALETPWLKGCSPDTAAEAVSQETFSMFFKNILIIQMQGGYLNVIL